jgi:hypothetical protein
MPSYVLAAPAAGDHSLHVTARGWLVLAVILLLAGLWYAVACVFWPFTRCWWCKDQPRRYQNKRRRAWRKCWVCKGTGERLRFGRAVYAHFRNKKRKAAKR